MRRRTALLAGSVATAALVAAGLVITNDTDTTSGAKQPTATMASTPARSAEPAAKIKPMPLNHQTSFNVTVKGAIKGTYKIVYRYGEPTAFQRNVSASNFAARPLGDTVLGTACKLKKDERAIPFSISMYGVSGDAGIVHAWIMPVLNKGKQEFSPPKGTVRVEYTGFNGNTLCNKNATLGTPTAYGFNGLAPKKFSSDVSGWLILSGKALNPKTGYKLAVISNPEHSPIGKNTVTDVKGGKPYATMLADGSVHPAGSSVPLVPAK